MKRIRAYTLVELLVVLAVIILLALQVMPYFKQQMIRTRRSEAHAALLRLMQQQERYRTRSNTYIAFSADATDADAKLFPWWSGNTPKTSAYEMEGTLCDGAPIADCVRILAKPGTSRVDDSFSDGECQELSLTSSGERHSTGPGQRCWP
ncbi:type IV pilin protein [Oxalobacteraceae bacterium A2-2]